jgi:homocitrate synthase NifV
MEAINFVDTTLRDGEQAAGIVFSKQDKLCIATLLDQVGVYEIEAGTPAMGGEEFEAIAAILALKLKSRVSTWNRAHIKDIKASLACGSHQLHITLPVSDIQIHYKLRKDRSWVLAKLQEAVSFAQDAGAAVTVGAEDASRADFNFLLEYACLAHKLGAERLRYADTVGMLNPFDSHYIIQKLISESGIDVEIHAHNDFGMAVANTWACVEAGARFASTTVLGLGERAGNCPLEMAADVFKKFLPQSFLVNQKALNILVGYVNSVTGRTAFQV